MFLESEEQVSGGRGHFECGHKHPGKPYRRLAQPAQWRGEFIPPSTHTHTQTVTRRLNVYVMTNYDNNLLWHDSLNRLPLLIVVSHTNVPVWALEGGFRFNRFNTSSDSINFWGEILTRAKYTHPHLPKKVWKESAVFVFVSFSWLLVKSLCLKYSYENPHTHTHIIILSACLCSKPTDTHTNMIATFTHSVVVCLPRPPARLNKLSLSLVRGAHWVSVLSSLAPANPQTALRKLAPRH